MAENTKIEWAHHTFNPWIGCTKVSPACDHCYAEADFATRLKVVQWGAGQPRKHTAPSTWAQPLRWNAEAERLGVRYRVFCASLADVFDNEVPREWRDDLATLILRTPHLDWLLLTKRIGNAADMLGEMFLDGPPTNIRIGTTITSQPEAARDIAKLLRLGLPNFLSMEPLLGPVSFVGMFANPDKINDGTNMLECIDWVIVGGESGPNARPMHPDWARSLRDQCQSAGVPFLFKQWGEWLPWHHFCDSGIEDGDGQQPTKYPTLEWSDESWNDVGKPDHWDSMDGAIDDQQCVGRVGKKAAGRLLDGIEHNGFPA